MINTIDIRLLIIMDVSNDCWFNTLERRTSNINMNEGTGTWQ